MKRRRERQASYELLFVRFSNRMEQLLVKVIIALGLLLLTSQIVLHVPQWRSFVSKVDRIEGKRSYIFPQSGELPAFTINWTEE